MKTEIGSNFWEINICESIDNKFWWDNSKYNRIKFMSGRNAILGLCQILSNTNRIILLPSYTCSTVVEPFLESGWQVHFYDINRDLSINVSSVNHQIEKYGSASILIHSYFGFNSYGQIHELVKLAKKHKLHIVEDLTQSVFSNHKIEVADYYIFSLRKFLAVPDGGLIVSKKAIHLNLDESYQELIDVSNKAFALKKRYMESNDDSLKQQYRKLYQKCNCLLQNNKQLKKMSSQTEDVFCKTDFESLILQRQRNYNFLLSFIKNYSIIKPIFSYADKNTTPLYMPIYVEGNYRKLLQEYLSEKNVYCPIIWPYTDYIDYVSVETKYIYEHILCIPIDQRYNEADMICIADEIKNFIEGIES